MANISGMGNKCGMVNKLIGFLIAQIVSSKAVLKSKKAIGSFE